MTTHGENQIDICVKCHKKPKYSDKIVYVTRIETFTVIYYYDVTGVAIKESVFVYI